MRLLAEGFPQFARTFDEIDGIYRENRSIGEKTYQFTCFALSIKNRSKPCLLKHFQGALEAGATVKELAYIMALTFRESAGGGDSWHGHARRRGRSCGRERLLLWAVRYVDETWTIRRTMRRTLALLALSLVWVAGTAAAAPQIAVDLQTYNYPDTVEGIAVVHTFVLSNVGNQELVITDVTVGCHCTTTQLATDRLQPGQSVELRAVLDTNGFSGRVARTITVASNDPAHPTIQLNLAGNVVDRQSYQKPVSDLFNEAYLLVDVRDATAYTAGHLLGAMSVPASEAASLAAGLPPSALIVIYDQSGSTSTLTAVSQAFHGGGLASVYALRGGLDLWQKTYKASFVVTGGTGTWGSFVDVSGARAYSTGTLQNFDISQLKSWYCVLIDLRSPSAYAAGHLAGAVNVDESGVAAFLGTLPSDIDVILYSDDGSASDRIVYGMWQRGSRAQSLLGGMAEWQAQHGNFLIVSSAG